MIEGIMFLIATSFLTLLAFVLILMYFNIIKVERKLEINRLTKEERKMYGWLKFDFDFDIRGKKFGYKSKKKNKL